MMRVKFCILLLCTTCTKQGSSADIAIATSGAKQLTAEDIGRVFNLYDRDGNKSIEDEELHGFLKDLMELVQEDYDADDIEEFKDILLRECDINHDGRIDKDELSMVLVSFARASQGPEEGAEEGEGADGGASKD